MALARDVIEAARERKRIGRPVRLAFTSFRGIRPVIHGGCL